MHEYLVIYDVPYIESFYFKVIADTYPDATSKFLNKLLEDKNITESEFNDLLKNYSEDLRTIPLFDIETI